MYTRIARIERFDHRDAVEVHDIAAMHAYKAPRIEPRFDASDGAAKRIVAAVNVQVHVVAGRLQPFDIARGDQKLATELSYQKPLGAVDRLECISLIRRGEQPRLALQSSQQQPVPLDDEGGR